jgi:hypothetical protein
MSAEDEMIDKLRLEQYGKVYSTTPPERPPYNPNGLKENPDFVKNSEPAKQYEFGMPLSVRK